MRVVFIGAGSVVFTRQLLRDILAFPELAEIDLALHDVHPERLRVATALAGHAAQKAGARPRISATTDRRAALAGADVVVNTVAIGGHTATLTDFDIPESFGLRQTIGDTLGIGGIFRALRTFPFLDDLARDMTADCPDAWLLNYTNPMAANVQYLARTAPHLKVAGLCHSVHWTVRGLCDLVSVPFEEVSVHSAGVNHQAWILRWEHHGRDLYPALDAVIEAHPQLLRRVRVDMYRRLGFYPTETSEHSAEYVPWYLGREEEVERLRIPVRAYPRISAEHVDEYTRIRDAITVTGALAPDPHPDHQSSPDSVEYAPQIIHSLATGTRRAIQVTTLNTGLITNLPSGGAVEVPATVDRLGIRPHHVGALPPQLAALNRNFLSVVDLTVAAAVEGDARHIRHAALCDPATAATLTSGQIHLLCDAMVKAHADALPEALREGARA
jgi:alpha-galactosidase